MIGNLWHATKVGQVTYAKREYQSTNNFHNSDRQLNNHFASFPVLLQKPNQTGHLLADNCCPHGQLTGWI